MSMRPIGQHWTGAYCLQLLLAWADPLYKHAADGGVHIKSVMQSSMHANRAGAEHTVNREKLPAERGPAIYLQSWRWLS